MEIGEAVPFVHLHLHTEYSLLDGAARLKKGKKDSPLFEECIKLGMPGVAITDHGNMMAAFNEYQLHGIFEKKLKDTGRTFDVIYGCEFYTANNMHEQVPKEKNHHLVLLAKSEEGLHNLIKLCSYAYTQGFYYKPRIDLEMLAQHSKGLVCLSACLAGVIPSMLVEGRYEDAVDYAKKLQSMFEPGDFYIELQDHGIKEERMILPLLIKLAKEIGAQVVATNDVHYIHKEDAAAQDVMMCIQTGAKVADVNRMKFDSQEFYLKSYQEMQELFSNCPEALTNTIEILNKCKGLVFKEKQEAKLYPAYVPPDGMTPYEYLRKLTFEGLKRRYGDPVPQANIERAETELNVIHTKGFDSYYLVVWDFINYSRSVDIPIGPGRGSGVGSIVAYAIGITNVEPLQFDLLFERFLNPERNSPPDFDIDICTERRGEVIEYVVKKYGREKVCQILTLGTLKPKNAIRDVARVYDVPLDLVNKTMKMLPNDPKLTLDIALGLAKEKNGDPIPGNKDFIDIYESNEEMHRVIDMAKKLEGMPKNCSMHAAGVVICRTDVTDEVPLLIAKKKDKIDIVTQFQKGELEAQGVLKMDFLGLITLTDIHHAIKYVKEDHGIEIDFNKMGVKDQGVYDMICEGDTDLVFQLENGGMRKFMTQMKPRNIEDLIVAISLYRPGPMDSIGDYLEARNHPGEVKLFHECLRPILEPTFGFFVYQEQVMNAARVMSTYSLGEADILRRCMGKKDAKEMEHQKEKFIDGAVNVKGIPEDVARKTFDVMERFATYAFNKSHAAAYAHLSYQTAYLKKYYYVELVTAVLNNRITKSDQLLKYINIAKAHGVEVLPADINRSATRFKVEDGKIRFGLTAVKNIGEAVSDEMVAEREKNGPYKSLFDFVKRVDTKVANKTTIENLTKAGAMDCFGNTRSTIMGNYANVLKKVAGDKKAEESGQMSFFDIIEEKEEDLKPVPEYEKLELLSMEKEVLNTYMSGHPLEEFRSQLEQYSDNLSELAPILNREDDSEGEDEDEFDASVNNEEDEEDMAADQIILDKYNNKSVRIAGILDNMVKKKTKKNEIFAVCSIEDLYAQMNVIFFTQAYDKYKAILKNDLVVELDGTIKVKDGEISMSVRNMKTLSLNPEAEEEKVAKKVQKARIMYLKADDNDTISNILSTVNNIVGDSVGSDSIKIQYNKKLYSFTRDVKLDDAIEMMMNAEFGDDGVKIVEKQ